ncbi:MAG: hypothetical protein OHK0038_15320 [Flammeovirgaceae bacterium]
MIYAQNKKVEYDSVLDEPEEVYRTSDEDEEKPTSKKNKNKKKSLTLEGERIGCECMNGELTYQTGSGACSKKGGVRFWIYKKQNGEIYKIATNRHLKELKTLEKSPNFDLSFDKDKQNGINIYETISVVAICALIMYVLKIFFDKKGRKS